MSTRYREKPTKRAVKAAAAVLPDVSPDDLAKAGAAMYRVDTMPRMPEIAGFAEAADIIGVSTSNLHKVSGLPEPETELKCGAIWRVADLRERVRNGPPKSAAADPRWTKKSIVEAIKLFVRRYDRQPTSVDFNPADARRKGFEERAKRFERDGDYPHVATVQKVFGSWSAALEASR